MFLTSYSKITNISLRLHFTRYKQFFFPIFVSNLPDDAAMTAEIRGSSLEVFGTSHSAPPGGASADGPVAAD